MADPMTMQCEDGRLDAAIAEELAELLPDLRAQLRWAVGRGWDLEDVLQDAAAKALRSSASLRDRSSPGVRAWVARIVWNCAKDRLRREGRSPVREDLGRSTDEPEAVPEVQGGGSLRRALCAAPAKERILLWMRATHGLSWEMTRRLSQASTPRVARTAHKRALTRLQHRLGDLGPALR